MNLKIDVNINLSNVEAIVDEAIMSKKIGGRNAEK